MLLYTLDHLLQTESWSIGTLQSSSCLTSDDEKEFRKVFDFDVVSVQAFDGLFVGKGRRTKKVPDVFLFF